MKTEFEPSSGYVVLQLDNVELTKRQSGILLLQEENGNNAYGNVVGLCKDDVNDIKIGERALYLKNDGTEFTLSGKRFLILKKDEILAILDA